jgi:hypothetical protein
MRVDVDGKRGKGREGEVWSLGAQGEMYAAPNSMTGAKGRR